MVTVCAWKLEESEFEKEVTFANGSDVRLFEVGKNLVGWPCWRRGDGKICYYCNDRWEALTNTR